MRDVTLIWAGAMSPEPPLSMRMSITIKNVSNIKAFGAFAMREPSRSPVWPGKIDHTVTKIHTEVPSTSKNSDLFSSINGDLFLTTSSANAIASA